MSETTGRKPTEYNWKFDRVNSKGEVLFKHSTNQTLEEVSQYLDSNSIKYEVRAGAHMLWLYNDTGKKYSYYYTTGRWSSYGMQFKKHYRSKSIEDFCSRFLNSRYKSTTSGEKMKLVNIQQTVPVQKELCLDRKTRYEVIERDPQGKDYRLHMLRLAKARARRRNIFFDLILDDIQIGTHCPILDIKFEVGRENWKNSPSLDRIDNSRGYEADNVIVVCMMANSIKNQATPDQIRKVADFYSEIKNYTGVVTS